VDAGRPTYTAQTFGPDRYGIWTMRSEWHNVPVIGGTGQAPGRDYGARDVSVDAGRASLSMDIAGAYPQDDVRTWRRTARLDRDAGHVVITDTWDAEPGGPTVFQVVAAGEVQVGTGRAEITAVDGAGVAVLTWHPAAPCTTTVRVLDDPVLSEVWGTHLTRLEIDLGATGRTFALTVQA
jgi:hypothetical protein